MRATIIAVEPETPQERHAVAGEQQSGTPTFYGLPPDTEFVYGSLQHDEFRLKRGLQLTAEIANGQVVVRWAAGGLDATGRDLPTALEAMRAAVILAVRSQNPRVAPFVDYLAG
jgi:hypothetical protein